MNIFTVERNALINKAVRAVEAALENVDYYPYDITRNGVSTTVIEPAKWADAASEAAAQAILDAAGIAYTIS